MEKEYCQSCHDIAISDVKKRAKSLERFYFATIGRSRDIEFQKKLSKCIELNKQSIRSTLPSPLYITRDHVYERRDYGYIGGDCTSTKEYGTKEYWLWTVGGSRTDERYTCWQVKLKNKLDEDAKELTVNLGWEIGVRGNRLWPRDCCERL